MRGIRSLRPARVGGITSGTSSPTAPDLDTAANYAVLAGTSVNNSNATQTIGHVGAFLGTVTNFPPGTVGGGYSVIEGIVAGIARTDASVAYDDMEARSSTGTLAAELSDETACTPGVWLRAGNGSITAPWSLDGGGADDGVWIFQIDGTLTIDPAIEITITNGGLDNAKNRIFFQVASTIDVGAAAVLRGTFIAAGGITCGAAAGCAGRLISTLDAVTIDALVISIA
jgi:hypothetical protein